MTRRRQNPPPPGPPTPSDEVRALREYVRRLWQTVREQSEIVDDLEARIEVLEERNNG